MNAKRSKRKKHSEPDPHDVLAGRVKTTAHHLAQMIHRVNPTGKVISDREKVERYRLKSQLQSLLIRDFSEQLDVERVAEPGNEDLVSLHFTRFDEDVCHVILSELDDDARSWIQRRLDEKSVVGGAEGEDPHQQNGPTDQHRNWQKTDMGMPPDVSSNERALVAAGRKALNDYDYAACEQCFMKAFQISNCSVSSCIALFELYVEHLGEYGKAIAIFEKLTNKHLKHLPLRDLVALAYAASGEIEKALRLVDNHFSEGAFRTYLLAIEHYISQRDTDRASELLRFFEGNAPPDMRYETPRLRQKIKQMNAELCEPMVKKMTQAWRDGDRQTALETSEEILAQSPRNKKARQIKSQIQRIERDEKIKNVLKDANEAAAVEDYARELSLLQEAISLGMDNAAIRGRIDLAQREINRQADQDEVDRVLALWKNGKHNLAMERYIGLNRELRERILQQCDTPRLRWLEHVISGRKHVNGERLIRAVEVLNEISLKLEQASDYQLLLSELNCHKDIISLIPDGRRLKRRLEAAAEDQYHANQLAFLDEAEALYLENEYSAAFSALEKIKLSPLSEAEMSRFDELRKAVEQDMKISALEAQYSQAVRRNDHLICRELAEKLTAFVDDEHARQWRERILEQGQALRETWGLTVMHDTIHPAWILNDAQLGIECTNCVGLSEDGKWVLFVFRRQKWLFLNYYSVEDEAFTKTAVLRLPKPIELREVEIVGQSVWVTGGNGCILEIRLHDHEILAWHDFQALLRENAPADITFFFPEDGHFWASGCLFSVGLPELTVIDVHGKRVVKSMRTMGYPEKAWQGSRRCVLMQDDVVAPVQVYSSNGRPAGKLYIGFGNELKNACGHPDGKRFVALTGGVDEFDEDPDSSEHALMVEVLSDQEPRVFPQAIDSSSGIAPRNCKVVYGENLFFVHHMPEPDTDNSCAFLDTYDIIEDRVSLLRRDRVPEDSVLISDFPSKRVFLVTANGFEIKVNALGRENSLDFGRECSDVESVRVDARDLVGLHKEKFCHFLSASRTLKYRPVFSQLFRNKTATELRQMVDERMQRPASDPEELLAFASSMLNTGQVDISDLENWIYRQLAEDASAHVFLADSAASKGRWADVERFIRNIAYDELNEAERSHVHHLIGMVRLFAGEIDRAMEQWELGAAYPDSKCALEEYLLFATYLKMSPAEREIKCPDEPMHIFFRTLGEAQDAMRRGEWIRSVQLLQNLNAPSFDDVQVTAKLAKSYLNIECERGEPVWFSKLAALALFLDLMEFPALHLDHILTPEIDIMTETELTDLAERAGQWLEQYE